MIQVVCIPARHSVLGGFCQRRLDVHYRLCRGSCLRRLVARQAEHSRYMVDILSADFSRFGIVPEIVITIGETETALIEPPDHELRVLVVHTRVEVEQRRCSERMLPL